MNTVAHSLFKNHYSLVHNLQFHVHSTFDCNKVSIPEIWFIKDKRIPFFSSSDPKLKFGLRSRSKQLQVIDLLTVFFSWCINGIYAYVINIYAYILAIYAYIYAYIENIRFYTSNFEFIGLIYTRKYTQYTRIYTRI